MSYTYTTIIGDGGSSTVSNNATFKLYTATDWILTWDTVALNGMGGATVFITLSNGTEVAKNIVGTESGRHYCDVNLTINVPANSVITFKVTYITGGPKVYYKSNTRTFVNGWTGDSDKVQAAQNCFDSQISITCTNPSMTIGAANDGYMYTKNTKFFTGFEKDAAGVPLIDGIWRIEKFYNDGYPFVTKYIPANIETNPKYFLFEKQ